MHRTNKQMAPQSLIPYERNAKQHSETQVAQIVASIEEFGWTRPVLVDEANIILAGHGAVLAALKLGMDKIPVVVMDGLTEPQKKALCLADNKIAENGSWDWEIIALEMDELKSSDIDFVSIGLDELLGKKKANTKNETIGDDRFLLQLEFETDKELETVYAEMQERKIECRILS